MIVSNNMAKPMARTFALVPSGFDVLEPASRSAASSPLKVVFASHFVYGSQPQLVSTKPGNFRLDVWDDN